MKKCFIIGLIMAMMPNMGVCAGIKSVDQLIAEKQAKMEKLKKCKGTTKNLKIAGISTLGITAVGVGANIAEAVILKDEQGKLETEKANLKTAQEKNAQLKSKQGKTDTAAQNKTDKNNYEGDCEDYVTEVLDNVIAGKTCPEYSNMNICKNTGLLNKIDIHKDKKNQGNWLVEAEKICSKELNKKAEQTLKDVCKSEFSTQESDQGDMVNWCIVKSDKYLVSLDTAKDYLKSKIGNTYDSVGCDIENMRAGTDGDYYVDCTTTDISNIIWIQNKDIDEEFKNNCKTVLMQNPKHNNGSEGVDEENSCTVTVGTQTSVANESALKKKAKEYADKMGDVCTDATIANYTDSNVAAGKARFRIVCKAGKIQNALYVMFNNVKCTTTDQTYKQDDCKD